MLALPLPCWPAHSVQPTGNPIRGSTQSGLRVSPTCSRRGREFFPRVAALAFPLFQSLDSGVGHGFIFTAEIRAGERRRLSPGQSPRSASLDFGVGHRFTAVTSPSPDAVPSLLRLWLPRTVGVGHAPPRDDDDTGPPMGGRIAFNVDCIRSSEHMPFSIVPDVGQRPENSSEVVSRPSRRRGKESADVLQHEVLRS